MDLSKSSGLNGDQNLSYCQFMIDSKKRRATCVNVKPLPLSTNSTLRWAGYTNEGSLASFDSLGVVRVLYYSTWRPICFLDKQVEFCLSLMIN